MSPDERRQFAAVEQHLYGLRYKVDRNRQIIDNGRFENGAVTVDQLNSENDNLTSVIDGIQTLLDYYHNSRASEMMSRVKTAALMIAIIAVNALWQQLLQYLSGR